MLYILLCAVLCLSLLPVSAARAAQAELEITVTPVPASLEGPGQVTLDIKVRVLNGDAYSAIYDFGVFYGTQELCSFPTIAAGEVVQQKLNAPINISAQDLGSPIELRCYFRDFDNENRSQPAFFTVSASSASSLSLTRTVSPPDAAVGSAVSITYTVKNTGRSTLTDVRLYDEVISATEPIAIWRTLEAGEGVATSSAIAVQTGMQSKPYVTYTSGNASERKEIEALPLHAAVDKLAVTIKADKTLINAGDVVTLTCTLLNEGTITYRDITIKEETLSDMPGITVLEPGKIFTYTKKIAPVSTGTYTLVASAKTADGKAVTVSSEPLEITVANSVPQTPIALDLRIDATPSVTEVTNAGDVVVDITLRNASAMTLRDVVIKEASLGEIEKLDTLPPGIDKFVKYTASVKATTTLSFTVEARTEQGVPVAKSAEPVTITLAAGVPEPTPYVWAETTPETQSTPVPATGDNTAPINSGATSILLGLLVLIGVLILICVIALIALWIRDKRRQNEAPIDPPYDDDDDLDDAYTNVVSGAPYDDEEGEEPVTRAKEPVTRYDDRTRPVRRRPPR